jgi:hypothetical protein
MSEEQESDGTWLGLKKTIIGVLTTAIMGLGTWGVTKITGGEEDEQQPQIQQVAPVINITNSNQQQQLQGGGNTRIIEKIKEIPVAEKKETPKKKTEKEQLEEAPAW